MLVRCIIGDNDTAFVINQDFMFSCHTSDCGSGDIFTFIEKMENLEFPKDFPKAVNKLAEILDVDITNLEVRERKDDYVKEVEKFLRYMKARKTRKKDYDEYILRSETKQVKKFRNFEEDTLIHFKLQYAKETIIEKKLGGEFTLYERLAIPITVNDKTIGYSLRKMRAIDTPKWFHIPHTLETGEILYNIDNCKEYDEIIVCEGMFDVWKWYEAGFENTVCTFGAHLTDEQYRLLLKTGKDIIWSYDNDSAGVLALKKASDMMRYKVNQWKIVLEEGKDPGECTSEELQELYNKRERII